MEEGGAETEPAGTRSLKVVIVNDAHLCIIERPRVLTQAELKPHGIARSTKRPEQSRAGAPLVAGRGPGALFIEFTV